MKKVKYFREYHYLYDFIQNNNVKKITYDFSFNYGYKLVYEENVDNKVDKVDKQQED